MVEQGLQFDMPKKAQDFCKSRGYDYAWVDANITRKDGNRYFSIATSSEVDFSCNWNNPVPSVSTASNPNSPPSMRTCLDMGLKMAACVAQ